MYPADRVDVPVVEQRVRDGRKQGGQHASGGTYVSTLHGGRKIIPHAWKVQ